MRWTKRRTRLSTLGIVGLVSVASILFAQTVPDELQRSIEELSTKKEITARVRAAQSIGNYGSVAAVAVPTLIQRLDSDPVWEVKEACAVALGKVGPAANAAVSYLQTALANKHSPVTIAAITAIGEILKDSKATKEVTETISAFLHRARDSEQFHASIKRSVALIGPLTVPTLLNLVANGTDPVERRFAVQMLGDSNDLSLDEAVVYRRLLKDADEEVSSRFASFVLNIVEQCALKGAPCFSELPKIQQLEIEGPVIAKLLGYDAGIKVSERYLNSIKSEQSTFGVQGFVVRYLIPLAIGALAVIAALLISCAMLIRKQRALRNANGELAIQNQKLEKAQEELVQTKEDLEQRIDEISDQRAAKERNEIARAVLQRFVRMPPSEERPGLKIASSFRDSSDVSGDFYNWSSRLDGSVLIYLVDVEGSSIEAAIQATHAAKVLERILTRGDVKKPAEELLDDADRAIQRELGQANIAVTMNLVEVHPDHIRLANAGMPAPLLFRHLQAQPQQLLAAGVYVGGGYSRFRVLPRYVQISVVEGDLLVLFSDGVLEALNAEGQIFGRHGIESAVARVRESDPKEIANEILAAAAAHAGKELPADDQTVVVVRFGKHAPVGTGAETLVTERLDESGAEFTLVNASNAADVCDSELRKKITDWLPSDRLDEPNRIWCAVWDGLTDAVSHGSYRGAIIYIRLRKTTRGIEVELEQPNEWRDWDKYLGTQRKASLTDLSNGGYPQSDNDVGGTATLLRLADSVTGSMQGRLLTLQFWFKR